MAAENIAEREKRTAARAAVGSVHAGMKVALGTGSTAALALRELAERFPDGGGLTTVASSRATEDLARQLKIPIRALEAGDSFDLMIDGADEVNDRLELTKGGGGALFREKFLAGLSKEVVIVVDGSKLVDQLGSRAPIPVEVVPFARPVVSRRLAESGWPNKLRTAGAGGTAWRTDNGNEILDISPVGGVRDPGEFDRTLHAMAGIVETGLFVGIADRVLVGGPDESVKELRAPSS